MAALVDSESPDKTIFGDFRHDEGFSELEIVPTHGELIGSLHFNQRVDFRRTGFGHGRSCKAVIFGGRRLTADCGLWEVIGQAQDWDEPNKPWRRFIARFEVDDDGYGKFQYLE